MSKFLDENGLSYLMQKFDDRFGGMYVPRKEFDSLSTDLSSDINKAMYGPYSVARHTVTYSSSVRSQSLNLDDAMTSRSPRIYIIDIVRSDTSMDAGMLIFNFSMAPMLQPDISTLSDSDAHADRFDNLSGGVQRVVFRFRGRYDFNLDSIYITLDNDSSFYLPYQLKENSPVNTSRTRYSTLVVSNIARGKSYVIADFVGHGMNVDGMLTSERFAVPQLLGCTGHLQTPR